MARPRTPTRVLELRGAFKKHPERRRERAGEPEPELGVGKPPKQLDASERAEWKAIAKACTWLTIADRWILAMTCRLVVLEANRKATNADLKQLSSNYAQLGMSPTGRTRVKAPPAKPKQNPFADLRRKA